MVRDNPLADSLKEASSEMEQVVQEEMLPLARLLEETFSELAKTIEDEFSRAARTGSFRFKEMVQDILNDLARLAAERYIRDPLEDIIGGLLGGGGAKVPGVGISPTAKGGNMTVNLHLGQTHDVTGFRQSETQIAASLSRLLSRGGRNL